MKPTYPKYKKPIPKERNPSLHNRQQGWKSNKKHSFKKR